MTTQLEYTSVPAWARARDDSDSVLPDDGAAAYIVAGIGERGTELTGRWREAIGGSVPVTAITGDDADSVVAMIESAIGAATVGVRLLVAGPVGDCLTVRARALNSGLEDDEIHVVATRQGLIRVFCAHCRATTDTDAGIDDLVPCAGCGRDLLIYYHVSRRKGAYLGFMADAETATSATEVTT
ncbi:hypothetical protein GII33_01075 [Gordonia pseudamarae]|jgi:hypothetical protein|uniref:Dimethylamine monooxygenase subunit DmmA-like C-terminal domain-containing protein n=1 Tax=Gordonia pseudamarae TaxID=2831662 RepID=A0ABX6ICQ6_9ACTN|nr:MULTISPECIES: dimethylamine monooxygenase subunit DmmA family protein [Gordonia]MBD0024003.1 hypothetical protein [Gordonia sp. (in: high G+C Gram-positive bacteria)]QHN24772.1 hypothetical protein GII33_01075 [Gordonia pseudamarae]QHN33705.1 hypothetical protein GII31_01075 [Gordonia pseudamarae]